jgi:hypothetical protein
MRVFHNTTVAKIREDYPEFRVYVQDGEDVYCYRTWEDFQNKDKKEETDPHKGWGYV